MIDNNLTVEWGDMKDMFFNYESDRKSNIDWSKFCSSTVGMGKSTGANMILSHCINSTNKPIIDWKDLENLVGNTKNNITWLKAKHRENTVIQDTEYSIDNSAIDYALFSDPNILPNNQVWRGGNLTEQNIFNKLYGSKNKSLYYINSNIKSSYMVKDITERIEYLQELESGEVINLGFIKRFLKDIDQTQNAAYIEQFINAVIETSEYYEFTQATLHAISTYLNVMAYDNSERFNELFDPNYLLKIMYDQSKRLEPKFEKILSENILDLF